MKTLLAAVDFSDASGKVLDCARTLASALQARLVVLHVVEPIASYVPVGAAMDVIEMAPPAVANEEVEFQRQALEKSISALRQAGITVETDVVVGLAADEIVSRANAEKADMIFLGSHGHGALYHLFAGNVVNGVLKRSPIPVVVVPIGK